MELDRLVDAEGVHLRVREGETCESAVAEALIRLALYEQAEDNGLLEWIGVDLDGGSDEDVQGND